MIGIRCEGCGRDLRDNADKCTFCKRPYTQIQLKLAECHHLEKMDTVRSLKLSDDPEERSQQIHYEVLNQAAGYIGLDKELEHI